MRVCEVCGEEISITRPGAKFCLDCSEKKKRKLGKERMQKGFGHTGKKFATFREQALYKQGAACVVCGWAYPAADSGGCVVHHIKPVSEGGSSEDQTNAAVLCPNCHVRAHHGAFTPIFLEEMANQAIRMRQTMYKRYVEALR